MKNKIISIALVGSILAPIATTISCSSTQETTVRKKRNPYDFGEKVWGIHDIRENNIEIINDNKEINWSILEENGVDGIKAYFLSGSSSHIGDIAMNSDMNIPKFIKVIKSAIFYGGIFNNKVTLHKELLDNTFLNSLEIGKTQDGFWKRMWHYNSGFMRSSSLKSGYEIEEGTKYIPSGLFRNSKTKEEVNEGVVEEMELPFSIEMIGSYAFYEFHKMGTWDDKEHVGEIPFSMDFSKLSNLTYIGENAFRGDFSVELIKFPSSYTPGKSKGRVNDNVPNNWGEDKEPVFSKYSKLPAHMFYSSPVEWTRSQKEILVGKSKVDEITWHNEWAE